MSSRRKLVDVRNFNYGCVRRARVCESVCVHGTNNCGEGLYLDYPLNPHKFCYSSLNPHFITVLVSTKG